MGRDGGDRISSPAPLNRRTVAALIAAGAWSVVLIGAGALLPAYGSTSVSSGGLGGALNRPTVTHSSATLVEVNGPHVLVVLAIPVIAVAVVTLALAHRRTVGRPTAGWLAWAAAAPVAGLTLLGILTIGFFVLPVAVLLLISCAGTLVDVPRRRGPGLRPQIP